MVAGLLCALCALFVALCFNIRKKQKAQAVSITALQARTAAHAQQIEAVGRAVAGLVPPDARPTAPHAAAAVYSGRDQLPPPPPVPRGLPSHTDEAPPSSHGSAEAVERQIATVERQIAEIAGAPAQPVETEGDREGVNPGDAPELGRLPGESRQEWGDRLELLRLAREQEDARAIRERFQRAADERDARDAAAAAPPGDDDRTIETATAKGEPEDPDDERTRVRARLRLPRLAALDGVALERPTSSPARTAAAFEASHGNPDAPAVRQPVKPGEPTASARPAQ